MIMILGARKPQMDDVAEMPPKCRLHHHKTCNSHSTTNPQKLTNSKRGLPTEGKEMLLDSGHSSISVLAWFLGDISLAHNFIKTVCVL